LNISAVVGGGSGGKLTLGGAGTLVLSNAANAYTGATTVGSGTLSLTGGLTGGLPSRPPARASFQNPAPV